MSGREIIVCSDPAELADRAAAEFASLVEYAIDSRERAFVALTGGSTPRQFYARLAERPWRDRVNWAKVVLFWGDERCVPPDHPDSNYRMAHEALLAKVSVPVENIHRIPTELGPAAEVANRYEQTIRAVFALDAGQFPEFDLVLLGLAEDGHVASLFPYAPTLRESERLVVAARHPGGAGPEGPAYRCRVTLTLRVLNNARAVLFLVSGESKARVLRDVIEGQDEDERLPARWVQPRSGRVTWLVDSAAAKLLTS